MLNAKSTFSQIAPVGGEAGIGLQPNFWQKHWILKQCRGSICDLFPKQWFIHQRVPSVTMEKSWTPIDSHCTNFNSLILSCHTWNIPKKCPSQIYKQWKSDLNTSWVGFMCDNSELSCWNLYNMHTHITTYQRELFVSEVNNRGKNSGYWNE